jgi:membrane-bound lytic murein transglycosylase D
LIILITTGCTEKVTKHVFVNEIPPAIEQQEVVNIELQKIESTLIVKAPQPTLSNITTMSVIRDKTVWDRLFSLYSLSEIENDRIDHEVQRFLKYPQFLAKIQRRAEPYLYFILDEIEAKEIPGELALLPAIESGFNAHAQSGSRALGLWQFMPATGRVFGLNQNEWYDGRKDIYKSTQAATTYLKQLAKSHDGDWALALASYNSGKSRVRKAIRKNSRNNLATDYWSLSLYKETMHYVPRLLAIAKIFAHADKYNIPLLDIPNKPHFSIVDIHSPIDLDIAAEIADMPKNDFFKLNPAFKVARINDASHHLLIEADKVDGFKRRLAKIAKKDRVSNNHTHKHQIKNGESLGFIAQKYDTSVRILRKINRLAGNFIKAGQTLFLPKSKITKAKRKSASKKTYIVKKGDTFWDIALLFDVRSIDIASWNNIPLEKMLQPGQKLIVRKG